MEHFKALWTEENLDGSFKTSLQDLSTDILASHEVLVQVLYSMEYFCKDEVSLIHLINRHYPNPKSGNSSFALITCQTHQ
jgi:hypothetical protein